MIRFKKEEFKVEVADKFWKKVIGLMFRKKLDHALLIPLNKETRKGASIHSMFMRFTFDAIFLNKDLEVVDMATIKPWTLNFTPKAAAKYIVEVPEYTIVKNLINLGDVIEIDEIEKEPEPERIEHYEKTFAPIKRDIKAFKQSPSIPYFLKNYFIKKKLTASNKERLEKPNNKKQKQKR
ncbi:DUF192 domain-containing protein [Candidatus Micrarchaeota archaeon]|nr:MAG: DUF192 domain-containing protein [Candidatus Micrarchaeota archaeon]